MTTATWYQLNINGVIGWVNGNYININSTNPAGIPIAGSLAGRAVAAVAARADGQHPDRTAV